MNNVIEDAMQLGQIEKDAIAILSYKKGPVKWEVLVPTVYTEPDSVEFTPAGLAAAIRLVKSGIVTPVSDMPDTAKVTIGEFADAACILSAYHDEWVDEELPQFLNAIQSAGANGYDLTNRSDREWYLAHIAVTRGLARPVKAPGSYTAVVINA